MRGSGMRGALALGMLSLVCAPAVREISLFPPMPPLSGQSFSPSRRLWPGMFGEWRDRLATRRWMRKSTGWRPDQRNGNRERLRRMRQIEAGSLREANGLVREQS